MATNSPDDLRLVDQYGLAAVLRVSPARVKALHEQGRLPAYRVGKRSLRFDVDECLNRLRDDGPERQGGAA